MTQTLTSELGKLQLNLKEAEEVINRMVDEIRVRMVVDEKGLVIYEFPEIIARFPRGRDI